MKRRTLLSDTEKAATAWARYLRVMRWMATITIGLVLGSGILLYRSKGTVSIHYYIAIALTVGFIMLLTSALMGFIFLSDRSKHDDPPHQ